MSCKSALYTANNASQSVAVNGVISLGSIIRRYGCAANLNGNLIPLSVPGYYKVDVSVTAAPTDAGVVTVTLYQDGNPVPGATGSVTAAAASDNVLIAFPAIIRLLCNAGTSNLSLVLSGEASTVSNVAVTVEKI